MSGKSIVLITALVLGVGILSQVPFSGIVPPRAAAADAGKVAKQSGWLATFTAANRSDTRSSRLVALHVPAGRAATPFLRVGKFSAVWKAQLDLELKGEYGFSAEGRGSVRVAVNGVVALEARGDLARVKAKMVTLKRGVNSIVVTYDSPAQGDAVLRLYWESEEFRREPLGLSQVQHDPSVKALLTSGQLREGRELLATHRCLNCHKADVSSWVKAGGMPELEMDAPSLAEIGARVQLGWLARWIQDSQALRPGATMPRLFADAARGEKATLDPRARDVAAYLATLDKANPVAAPAKKDAIEKGTRLFAQLGCIGCHLPPDRDDFADKDHGRLPLRDVVAKWKPAALTAFLRQPDRHYAWIRMPNFHLNADEADHLVAYLRNAKPRDVFPKMLTGASIENGKKLVNSAGCTSCHSLAAGKPPVAHPSAPPYDKLTKEGWSRGCMATKVGSSPSYDFTPMQRSSMQLLIATDRTSPSRDVPGEFAARQLIALRCNACHKRDGHDDRWTQLKDENDGITADLPALPPEKDSPFPAEQVRPTLTWAGEKLKPEWTAEFLAGKLAYKPRPYLRARMPAFPRRSLLLAQGLAAEHGCPPRSPADSPVEEKRAVIGRALSAKNKWNCVGCHNVGTAAAVGVFEAPGVNFAYGKERLRREYFDRWLWAPTRVEPGTKMPVVYIWGRPSQLPDVLGGDAGKQIDALWQYLQQGKKMKPPAE